MDSKNLRLSVFIFDSLALAGERIVPQIQKKPQIEFFHLRLS